MPPLIPMQDDIAHPNPKRMSSMHRKVMQLPPVVLCEHWEMMMCLFHQHRCHSQHHQEYQKHLHRSKVQNRRRSCCTGQCRILAAVGRRRSHCRGRHNLLTRGPAHEPPALIAAHGEDLAGRFHWDHLRPYCNYRGPGVWTWPLPLHEAVVGAGNEPGVEWRDGRGFLRERGGNRRHCPPTKSPTSRLHNASRISTKLLFAARAGSSNK